MTSISVAIRFVASGAANMLLTYVLFILLKRVVQYALAYTIVYVVAIAFSYVVNSRFVFGVHYSIRAALLLPLVYLTHYLYGVGLLLLLVQVFAMRSEIAVIMVIVSGIPLTYVLSKLVFDSSSKAPGGPRH